MQDHRPDTDSFDIAHDRVSYELPRLTRGGFVTDPFEQFAQWLQAASAQLAEPNAMVVATADDSGRVRARTVLLRGFDRNGFTFFTNYDSAKGRALAHNPEISACFSWVAIHRQIIVEGRAEKVSGMQSDEYFASRPYESQVASAASPQSQVIDDIAEVELQMQRLREAHPDAIPRPRHWGGYRIVPRSIEFWQGNRGRLHDRFRYVATGDRWRLERLAP